MSTILEAITTDILTARRAKDSKTREALTFIKDAIDKRIKEARGADVDQVQVLRSEAKKRNASITEFRKAGRDELADKEQYELDLITGYLPAEVSDETINGAIIAALAEFDGTPTMRDMGTIMKATNAKLEGEASGARVSALVKAAIASA